VGLEGVDVADTMALGIDVKLVLRYRVVGVNAHRRARTVALGCGEGDWCARRRACRCDTGVVAALWVKVADMANQNHIHEIKSS
jgi:hypothetical protein